MFAIEVENVSKIYRMYNKPSDRLKEVVFRKPLHTSFSSLTDISLAVSAGESLGIIGDNGAGKSTLLKIVAGTLTPTSGSLKTKGRVAALLELGAGFHYDFTGRQNIWMNASLMGLDRAEIEEREESIIDFSELGPFIDRPIKTYSSGMVVRLAFSIATSVDPDILIIDEALSVGDHYFQKKSINRMLEFKRDKKTILFCSHGMFLVNQLCDRAVWLSNGRIHEDGIATHITANYENYSRERTKGYNDVQDNGPDPEGVKNNPEDTVNYSESSEISSCGNVLVNNHIPAMVTSIRLNDSSDDIELHQGDELCVDVEYFCDEQLPFFIAAAIQRNDELLCNAVNMAQKIKKPLLGKGPGKVTLRYDGLPFLHGRFSVIICMMDDSGLQCYHKKESASFSVLPLDTWDNELGLLKLGHEWVIT